LELVVFSLEICAKFADYSFCTRKLGCAWQCAPDETDGKTDAQKYQNSK